MYILTNAMKNLLRNKGRNILIASVSLVIMISAVIALTIGNTSSKIIEDTRLRIGSKVNIGIDLLNRRNHLREDQFMMPEIGIHDFYSYADSDYLSKSFFNVQLFMNSTTLFAVDDESKGQDQWDNPDGSDSRKAGSMTLIGNSDPDTLADFSEGGGKAILPGGKMFGGLNECIISSDLAELNGISVGDTIAARSVFPPVKIFELVVVGIYSDEADAYPGIAYEQEKVYWFNRRN